MSAVRVRHHPVVHIAYIAAGIALLYLGGEFLIRAAVALTRRFGISELIIGLTVVALGTSLPELCVSIVAVLRGSPEIVVSNIIGSNIINIALIFPLVPLVTPLLIPPSLRKVNYPIMLLSFTLVLVLLLQWSALPQQIRVHISRGDGVVLLVVLTGYVVYAVRSAAVPRTLRTPLPTPVGDAQTEQVPHIWSTVVLLVVGSALLALGSELLLQGATAVAILFGISTRIIALTIVAHGTNLPEIFTTLAALRRKKSNIIVGNLIGSNIINSLFVLGVVGVSAPLFIDAATVFLLDVGILIAISVYIFVIMIVKNGPLHVWRGMLILLPYIGYYAWILSKG